MSDEEVARRVNRLVEAGVIASPREMDNLMGGLSDPHDCQLVRGCIGANGHGGPCVTRLRSEVTAVKERNLVLEALGASAEQVYDKWVAAVGTTPLKRYDQCGPDCTVDCGHCKGQGAPLNAPQIIDRSNGNFVGRTVWPGSVATPEETR